MVKKKTIALIVLIILVVGILAVFLKPKTMAMSSLGMKTNKLEVEFFDAYGNPVHLSKPFSTVAGYPGIAYMSFNFLVNNSGDTGINNITLVDIFPPELAETINKEEYRIERLEPGASYVAIAQTARDCETTEDCDVWQEKCVGNPKKCRLDVSMFYDNVTFGFRINGSWTDAYGNVSNIEDLAQITLNFALDGVLLRFEKRFTEPIENFTNSWVAYDANSDGIMEKYGGDSIVGTAGEVSCALRGSSEFIAYYGDYVVQKSTNPNEIFLCKNDLVDRYVSFRTDDIHANNSVTKYYPFEPYSSENCGKLRPCQEVYTIRIEPPPTCTDTDNDINLPPYYPNGRNYTLKGVTSGIAYTGEYRTTEDSCRTPNYYGDGLDYVIEWFCWRNPYTGEAYVTNTNEPCLNGCLDGACL